MSRPYTKKHGGGGFHSSHHRGSNGTGGSRPHNAFTPVRGGGFQRNNSFAHRGGRLGVPRGHVGVTNPSADVMKTLLKLLFEKTVGCFNEETGMLTIANMRNCADLAAAAKTVDFNSVSFCRSLAEVLRDQFAYRVRVIDMHDNQIRKLTPFLSALVEVGIHHGITAINVSDNTINELSFLGPLKNFGVLKEVLLTNNPVTAHKDYRGQVLRALPNLCMLDSQPIQRLLLALPNPLPIPPQSELAIQVLEYLNRNVLSVMNYGNVEQTVPLYAPNSSALSISRHNDPLPSRLPIDAAHRTVDLSKSMRSTMQADLSTVRSGMHCRNLIGDVSAMRNVAKTAHEIRDYIKTFCAAGRSPSLRFYQLINANASVCVLDQAVKMRMYTVTLHGRAKYLWNPVDPSTGNRIFPEGKEPFVSFYFDRTIVLIDANNIPSITNDMIFCRPDHSMLPDDDTALFFAGRDDRVERMRRKLLPGANAEVMKYLVDNSQSDYALQGLVQKLQQTSMQPESLQSVEAVKQILGLP